MRPGSALLLLMGFVLLGVVGCGATATPKPLPMAARVLGNEEFPGYTSEPPRSSNGPQAYLAVDSGLPPSQRAAWISRLRSEGFKKGLTEFLDSLQGVKTGLSGVIQLGSAASAQAELAAESHAFQRLNAETFPVRAIPGAAGYGFSGSNGGGQNVLFADGPFLYLVGYSWSGAAHGPKQSALISVATKLYTRVRGHPAP
jgi:hypothetical protein